MVSPLPTVGIMSIGEMGLGIAKLLLAHNVRVLTNVSGRSEWTRQRAASASIELVDSDKALGAEADYILSIVPPRDAASTATRIIDAIRECPRRQQGPLYYLDLNAISPRSARDIAERFQSTSIRFIDGGIIGPAPKAPANGDSRWSKPSLPISGPHKLEDAPISGRLLVDILNVKHVDSNIGQASGLKMCFASTTKGFTAIAIQSFTTAQQLGVLSELQGHLKEYSPKTGDLAMKGLVGMPPKAYRWVREMQEIADTFNEEGGFDKDMLSGASEVYRIVSEDTDLGAEKTEARDRGRDPEDVAKLVASGIERKK